MESITASDLKGVIALQAKIIVTENRWDTWEELMYKALNRYNKFEGGDWFETRHYYCWSVRCVRPSPASAAAPFLTVAFVESEAGNYEFASAWVGATATLKPASPASYLGHGPNAYTADMKGPKLRSGNDLVEKVLSHFGMKDDSLSPKDKAKIVKAKADWLAKEFAKQFLSDGFGKSLRIVFDNLGVQMKVQITTPFTGGEPGMITLNAQATLKGKPVTASDVSDLSEGTSKFMSPSVVLGDFYRPTHAAPLQTQLGKDLFKMPRYSSRYTAGTDVYKEMNAAVAAGAELPLQFRLVWVSEDASWLKT